MTILTDAFVRVIVSSLRTNRARCALYKKSLIYSTKEAFVEKAVVELVYKSMRNPTVNVCKCESIAKIQFNLFLSKYIYQRVR